MPAGLAPSDRKLLRIGGALLVILLTASVEFAPRGEESTSAVPSSYSAASGGAEAAYLLLTELRYPVRRWENSPTELNAGAEPTLLILADPTELPSEKERKAIVSFVEDGGHILFTGALVSVFFKGANVSWAPPDPDWKSYSPSVPSRLTRGARQITMQPRAFWGRLDESQLALYGEEGSPAVIRWKLGKGEVIWWAGPTPLTNAGITREDNLTFFLNSVSNWSAAKRYQIDWDEYFHGQRSSIWSYIGKTSLAWGGIQLAILALAVVFTFSRRSGPIYLPARVSRLSPLEFVDTLGGLYERAGAASSAVAISYQRLRSLLTRQLSLPSETPNAELAVAAEQRLGWKDSGLGELLRRAETSSYMTKLKPREGLELVRQLEQQASRLEVRAQYRQEKI